MSITPRVCEIAGEQMQITDCKIDTLEHPRLPKCDNSKHQPLELEEWEMTKCRLEKGERKKSLKDNINKERELTYPWWVILLAVMGLRVMTAKMTSTAGVMLLELSDRYGDSSQPLLNTIGTTQYAVSLMGGK
jgi:hypothetical protein